jgi:hypothetical protein
MDLLMWPSPTTMLRAQDSQYEILWQNYYCTQYLRLHEQSSECHEHFIPADDDTNELNIYISEKLNEPNNLILHEDK